MTSGAQGGGRRGWALVLFVLALLLQVNAPVARAAVALGEVPVCHTGQSGRAPVGPDSHHEGCAACAVCQSVQPTLAGAGPSLPARLAVVRVTLRPETGGVGLRGPPERRPRARGPPSAFA